jgi:nitroreductase
MSVLRGWGTPLGPLQQPALPERGADDHTVWTVSRAADYTAPRMEVFEAIRTLLAVRSYQDTPVPAAVVRRIVEAGRLTGSGMNRQPWHFIVIRDRDTLRRLGALASSGPYVAQAPLAIVVATDKSRFAVSDASRAIQSMLLAAWGEGVGSNWVGFGGLEKVKAVLEIPASLEVLAILPFGYPARAVGRGKKQRKPLGEVAHLERYGRPFE